MPLTREPPAGCNIASLRKSYLMVPKTGCESTIAYFDIGRSCDDRRDTPIDFGGQRRSHWRFYTPCSIANLREPCERIQSAFRHLHCMYSPFSIWCAKPKYRKRCGAHWIHRIRTVDAFAQVLLEQKSSLFSLRNATYFDRHITVTLPQSMYIGEQSWVLCTAQLQTELPALARVICPPALNTLKTRCPPGTRVNGSRICVLPDKRVPNYTHHLHKSCASHLTNISWVLTERGRAAVRLAYPHDHALWHRLCSSSNESRDERGRQSGVRVHTGATPVP